MESMLPSSDPAPESLMAQHDWVRRLVRRLVRDHARAEDVLQATWLCSLRHPPRSQAGVPAWRSWIARVARNLALRDGESARARHKRESIAARDERLPSAHDIAEREELRARIVAHVLALPEPYRSTLVLRFYEELTPRAIARVQRVNGSTVRNRLARGLEMLRERLARERGCDWVASCLLALPLQHSLELVATSKGAVGLVQGGLVTKKLGLAAAAVVFATASWMWVRWSDGNAARERASARQDVAHSAPAGVASEGSAVSAGTAELVRANDSAEIAKDGGRQALVASEHDGGSSALARLFGTIVDARGQAIRRAADASFVDARSPARLETNLALAKFEVLRFREKRRLDAEVAVDTVRRDTFEEERKTQIDEARVELLASSDHRTREDAIEFDTLPPFRSAMRLVNVDVLRADMLDRSWLADRPSVLAIDDDGRSFSAQAGEDGSYELAGLHAGHWSVLVRCEGKSSARQDVEIKAEERSNRLDLKLADPRRVRVRLRTSDGRDLEQAIADDRVLATRVELVPVALRAGSVARLLPRASGGHSNYGGGSYAHKSSLNEDERAQLGDAAGVLTITDAPPLEVGLAVNGALVARQPLADDAQVADFALSLDELRRWFPSVSVAVLDGSTHRPVPGARVTIEGVVSAGANTEFERAIDELAEFRRAKLRVDLKASSPSGAPVDLDGVARIDCVPAGWRSVYVEAPGYARFHARVAIEPGTHVELEPIELTGFARLRGRIVDAHGKPAQVNVSLVPLERFDATHEDLASSTWVTDERGEFDIPEQRRERYVLRVTSGDEALAPVLVDASAGDVSGIELALVAPTDVTLRFASEPAQDAELRVRTSAGLPALERDLESREPARLTLAPGSYVAEVREHGRRVSSARFSVHAAPLEVRLGAP